jgi:hypothetical protein
MSDERLDRLETQISALQPISIMRLLTMIEQQYYSSGGSLVWSEKKRIR